MATFISLMNFTSQGARDCQASPKRAEAFKKMAKAAGATVENIYWTLGAYDGVIVLDAPDDETATSVMLGLAAKGNVTTQTLRAFAASEMEKIIVMVPD